MKFDYRKLDGRITEKFGTRRAFAKAIGTTESTLSNKLNCKTSLMTGDIILWANTLGIATEDIGSYFFVSLVQES